MLYVPFLIDSCKVNNQYMFWTPKMCWRDMRNPSKHMSVRVLASG